VTRKGGKKSRRDSPHFLSMSYGTGGGDIVGHVVKRGGGIFCPKGDRYFQQ